MIARANTTSIFTVFLLSLCSCSTSQENKSSIIPELSGDQRAELESVLGHYADAPEKLSAAKFLIENMPGHYSFADTALLRRYHLRADSFITANPEILIFNLCDSIDEIARIMGIDSSPKVSDCQIIKADYLIKNIDQAFEQWRTNPWLHHLDFEQFCEYVLPYKVKELQPLDNWREKFSDARLYVASLPKTFVLMSFCSS